jgi:hypothetical protein
MKIHPLSHLRCFLPTVAVFALAFAFTPQVQAGGTPLLCHPYAIGAASSLPGGHDYHGCSASYDRQNLTAETLALLTPETPVLVRMETLRRAALYAGAKKLRWRQYEDDDATHVRSLLGKLQTRVDQARGAELALAVFDLGFFRETLRQSNIEAVDGYALLVRAAELRGGDPDIPFALALASSRPLRKEFSDYAAQARAGAKPDSLLAANLVLIGGK